MLVNTNNPAPACIAAGIAISIVFALLLLIVDAARGKIVRVLKRQ